ncbi:hypothetical protein KU392_11775 [Advenella alkanexedens]|jgi:hypothetical protein|uniref:Phasin domain-containing protein n=1 Tax=Advenella alkanexedens TaxID=1481665 RepID=A0ABS6NQQ6_9BURK|nr:MULTISPECIES: hypothetical protein [Advenella]MBV4397923.1 hypothetical protein [Advenella alkanexedens]MDD3756823.1 hypothetical protein [Advenella sp.]NLN68502.1 hypothetical protein [Alcaligenaceae bacterium]WKU20407.1 hypothetical protein Q3V95_05140 [Advenella alkanexedens]
MGTNNKASTYSDGQLSQNLFNANMELSRQMGKLFQENNQRWGEFIAAAFGESRANMEKLLNINNDPLRGQAFNDLMVSLSQCANGNRALTQQALENQRLFLSGMAEILQQWQRQSVALADGANTMPWNNMFADMFKQLNAGFLPFNYLVNANRHEKEEVKEK